jgi:hypothetical protein
MAEQTRNDPDPNRASEMEKAEGSRETATASQNASRDATTGNAQHGAGITNRPLEAEQQEQESLPPRGRNKDQGHA